MSILLSAIMAALMTAQTVDPQFRNNSLYAFNIDGTDGSIVVMNTQTGDLFRCTKDFTCDNGLVLDKPKK
jgi:predicted regulator of Ras-like GTPase activity (Roadblock/LC7/MglB family)